MKLYKCEIPDCDRKAVIRSKIKNRESEYFGKMACPICAEKYNVQKEKKVYAEEKPQSENKPKSYRIKYQTEKNKAKRKEERADYPEFFKKHIEYIKENNVHCCECGDRLRGDSSNVVHLVAKRNNPEISTNDLNIIYLCGLYSNNNCHSKYDQNFESREKMKVFPLAVEKFKLFRDDIVNITKEVLHYDQYC